MRSRCHRLLARLRGDGGDRRPTRRSVESSKLTSPFTRPTRSGAACRHTTPGAKPCSGLAGSQAPQRPCAIATDESYSTTVDKTSESRSGSSPRTARSL